MAAGSGGDRRSESQRRRSRIGGGWFLGGMEDELVGRAILHAVVGVVRLIGIGAKGVLDQVGHFGP